MEKLAGIANMSGMDPSEQSEMQNYWNMLDKMAGDDPEVTPAALHCSSHSYREHPMPVTHTESTYRQPLTQSTHRQSHSHTDTTLQSTHSNILALC